MARPIFVLALILLALVGLVSAAEPAATKAAGTAAPTSSDDDHIGNVGGDDASAPGANDAVAGPIGSLEDAAKNMPSGSAAQGPSSGATANTLRATSAVAGASAAAAAVAGYFVI